MIELVSVKDVRIKHTKYGPYAHNDNLTKRRIVNRLEFRVRNKKNVSIADITKDSGLKLL